MVNWSGMPPHKWKRASYASKVIWPPNGRKLEVFAASGNGDFSVSPHCLVHAYRIWPVRAVALFAARCLELLAALTGAAWRDCSPWRKSLFEQPVSNVAVWFTVAFTAGQSARSATFLMLTELQVFPGLRKGCLAGLELHCWLSTISWSWGRDDPWHDQQTRSNGKVGMQPSASRQAYLRGKWGVSSLSPLCYLIKWSDRMVGGKPASLVLTTWRGLHPHPTCVAVTCKCAELQAADRSGCHSEAVPHEKGHLHVVLRRNSPLTLWQSRMYLQVSQVRQTTRKYCRTTCNLPDMWLQIESANVPCNAVQKGVRHP